MQVHGSCVALDGAGVVLLGRPGCGKSDLALRLIDRGFMLVADDRIDVVNGVARAPAAIEGLLEVRGLGLVRLAFLAECRLALAVELDTPVPRLPQPRRHDALDLPLITVDGSAASAPQVIALALATAQGNLEQIAGAFRA